VSRSAYDAANTPQLLLLVSDLLQQPPAFGARHKALLQQLLQPLQEHLAELSAEQLTQVNLVWPASQLYQFVLCFGLTELRVKSQLEHLAELSAEQLTQVNLYACVLFHCFILCFGGDRAACEVTVGASGCAWRTTAYTGEPRLAG
jgi:hypothetical protein